MTSVTLEGVVLRVSQYKESDAVITLLTPQKGVITVFARGIMNLISKNRPATQLFCYSEFDIGVKDSRYLLKTAELKEQFYNIRLDIAKIALANYIVDSASHLCTSENDETQAFRLVLNMLSALNVTSDQKQKPFWQIKTAYEIKMCAVNGFMPDFESCAGCDEKLGEDENKAYYFSLSEAAIYCEQCFKSKLQGNKSYHIKLSNSALLALKYIINCQIERVLAFRLEGEHIDQLCELAEKYFLNVAEKSFDTLNFYKSLK